MAKGGSKKGSPFERWFCREISLWYSQGKDDNLAWRTAGSGGRATNRAKKGLKSNNHYGDIMYTDPCMKPFFDYFTIEMKRGYSRHTLQDLLDPPTRGGIPEYIKWFEQAARSADQAGSVSWMIILKRDQRPPLMIIPREQMTIMSVRVGYPVIYLNGNQHDVIMMRLEDWFKNCNPKTIENKIVVRRETDRNAHQNKDSELPGSSAARN